MFHIFVFLQFPIQSAFPHFHDIVTVTFQILGFLNGRLVEFVHGVAIDGVHAIAGITFWASYKKRFVVAFRTQ